MISVALASYNGEKYIETQIKSILDQTYQNFEIIIVDDCSTDNTVSVIKNLNDSRIRIFQNEKNLGFRKNFEKIIENCTGEYIAFCDQDDVWLPNHLTDLISNINDNLLICGNAILVNQNLEEINVTMLESLGVDFLPNKPDEWFKFLLFTNVFQGTACLAKTDFVKSLLPFPENIKYHDHWLAINAAIKDKVCYIDKPILKYRQHSNNITLNNSFNFSNRVKLFLRTKNQLKSDMYNFIDSINTDNLSNEKHALIKIAKDFFSKKIFIKRLSICHWYFTNYQEIKGNRNKKLQFIRSLKYLMNL